MATTATPSEVSEGPVLNLINKRLRALRKKQNRISQMEDSVSKGKTLNHEQLETLASKPSILGAIEELERLRHLIPPALAEELETINSSTNKENKENTNELSMSKSDVEEVKMRDLDGVIEDLLKLLYFGSMFDVKSQSDYVATMYRKSHERGCCLTYDYVTDDANVDLLGEKDLDLIAMIGEELISRPVDSSLSHKKALERCVEQAKLWVGSSEQLIDEESNVSYATLRAKLNKIMASDYFTTTPEMKPSVEMVAAAENYQSFQVPSNGSVVPVNVPVEVEDSTAKYEHKEHVDENFKKHETYDGQFGHVEELHKDTSEVENSIGFNAEVEADLQQNEMQNSQELENREQVNAPRRQHRGGRGGGHKGYHNGRGGRGRGGYQNGYNQNYEQADKYYPRYNANFRGRGGRGGGARGNYNPAAEGGRLPFEP